MYEQGLFDGCLLISPEADLISATADMPATAGVCLLSTADNQPVLLLYGANLRTLVRRRLRDDQTDQKTRRTRLRPIIERIWFRRTYSAFETQWAYFNIARTVYPDRFAEFFPRLDVWFISVDPDAEYPYFDKTNQLNLSDPLKSKDASQIGFAPLYWGPFSTKKSASQFLQTLQNLFNLCRCPHLLAQAPHAAGCSYAQMNRCAAVCNGSVSQVRYRQIIDETIDFLNHLVSDSLAALESKMKRSSADLQFEKAQRLKNKITQVQKLLAPAYRWVVPLEKFYVLAFETGPAVKLPRRRAALPTVTPFIISPGAVSQVESFPLTQAHEAAQTTLDHLNLIQMQSLLPQTQLLAWTANYLYRKIRGQGLYLLAREKLNAPDLAQKIRQHFDQRKDTHKNKLKLDTFSMTAPDDSDINET